MKTKTVHPVMRSLLQIIDEAYERKAWHGPNLRGSIRGVTARQAAWRPALRRHNICEIVLHAAYWKYIVRRRLLGDKKGAFPVKGSNWFPSPTPLTEKSWRNGVLMLEQSHRSMRQAIAGLARADLSKIPPGNRVSNLTIISGIALHDVYHAGQIQLLKRLQK